MAEPNLQEIHDFLMELAKKAASDLVTETDKAVEAMVSSSLKQAYPTYSFLGEESSPTASSSRLTSSPTFVVDPIDGTTNFVHAHPYVSISLAFAHNRKPLVGIVYNPFTQHLYSAIKGHGAFLTAPSIPTSQPAPGAKVESTYTQSRLPLRSSPPPLASLSQALVAIEWGNERSGSNFETKHSTFAALTSSEGGMVHSLRSLGSAALNMCAVARGDLDIYWEGGCWAWDVAAGWVIVEEAGGMVVGGNPGEWEPEVDGRRYLVVRGGAGKEMVEQFWGLVRGKLVYEL